jgi:uncharacterized protein YbaP (TraB family)
MRHRLSAAPVPVLLAVLALLSATLVAAQPLQEERGRGLLWEISGGGAGADPSYLFGTIHSEDPAVLQLAAPVRQALQHADSIVLEVMMDTDAMMYSSAAMLMADGRSLSGILDRTLFEETARAMRARGIPGVVLERMKPWAVATTLSMPPPDTGLVLDLKLFRDAQQAGKKLYGLEDIREQLDVFDTLPERDQVALLQDVVDNLEYVDAMNAALLAAWKRRDLDAMLSISDEAMQSGDPRLARDFEQRLIIRRNRLMAQRMEPHLQQGRAFIAVGALHLPGEAGLLRLLERQGYTLRVLY